MHQSEEVTQAYHFGVFELNERAHELRKQGHRIRLQDQPFQILKLLLQRAGDVVTRDELRQNLWPSSVYVDFDHGLNNAIARVRDALDDTAGTPQFIETLPRLGYRFIYPVERVPVTARVTRDERVTETEPQSDSSSQPVDTTPRWSQRRRILIFALAALLVVAGLFTGLQLTRRSDSGLSSATLAREPAIAVLPFVNMSNDSDKNYFADGLAEELMNKLAGIQGLKVVGRTPSSSFKDQNLPTEVIAERLNVDQFLEGSIRISGSQVRVTVQLIDAKDGYHRWSQTYDREFADILQVQEDIARAVAAALQVQLLETDELRLRHRGTRNAHAHRLYLVARELKGEHRAKELYLEAIALDPDYAAAYAGLSNYYFRNAWQFGEVDESFLPGRAAADRAMALDSESSDAFLARANMESLQARFKDDSEAYARARTDYLRAIELDPENPRPYFDYARTIVWDDPQLASSLHQRTAELNPLWELALASSVNQITRRESYEVRRKRLRLLAAQSVDPNTSILNLPMAFLEEKWGHLDEALIYLRPMVQAEFSPEFSKALWSVYMSLGDRAAAREVLAHRGNELSEVLRQAAALNADNRLNDAFATLERHRLDFPHSRVLDLPAARQALITGRPETALTILRQRLPNLASGLRPVSARNVIPALDLAAAYSQTGQVTAANQLLERIAAFLDGPDSPYLPMFTFFRARTHALADEPDLALAALERAYDEGFRQIWAPDLNPQPLLYVDSIDMDPAFASLRSEPRYRDWRERIRVDNARQLERHRARGNATSADVQPVSPGFDIES